MRKIFYFNSDITRIATSQHDFFERFDLYAKHVAQITPQTSPVLTMLIGGAGYSRVDKQINIIALPRNPILQLVKLIRTLKHSVGAKTLIVGDNDVSLMLGWLASRFANDTKIQMSLHASLDHILFPTGIFNILRKHLFFWSLKRVNSIRMVSSIDVERVAKLLPIPAPEIVVAPVPIKIPVGKTALSKKTKMAFIGRIHPERGLGDLLDILKLLNNDHERHTFIIVGDGEKLDWLKSQIPVSESLQVQFKGRLELNEIQELWSEIKVLVSCAATESYGLTLREALLNGSFVVARANATTLIIESKLPNHFKTYNTPQDAVEKIKQLMLEKSELEELEKFRQTVRKEQEDSLLCLARSWVY